MLNKNRVPLAWLNLVHRPLRFCIYLLGISIAVLLMFVQLGFWGALLDSVVGVIQRMKGQLVIVNHASTTLSIAEPFSLRRVAQARAVNGVEKVIPVYIRSGIWKWTQNGPLTDPQQYPTPSRQYIRVLAYDPATDALDIPEVAASAQKLRVLGSALRDRQSLGIYHMPSDPDFTAELNDRGIHLIGTFTLGTDFAANGNLIMSDVNFAHFFHGLTPTSSPLDGVDVGLIRVDQGSDLKQIKAQLEKTLPDDVEILTLPEFIKREQNFWQSNTPIGFVFLMGLIVGFVVGVIICSQILSADVNDHLSEYATLKAIGYSNTYLTRVILEEALILSVLGFVPGALLSKVLYVGLGNVTGLPLEVTFWRGLAVFGITVCMCIVSGFLALGKVWVADPAEVF
jgi:putative ABC transport system permease protein